jgi:hypothetical protein
MVAAVALTYFEPSNVEMLSDSASAHADPALELQLIRAAPHATVRYSLIEHIE